MNNEKLEKAINTMTTTEDIALKRRAVEDTLALLDELEAQLVIPESQLPQAQVTR